VRDKFQLLMACAVSLSYNGSDHTMFGVLLFHVSFIWKEPQFKLPLASLFDNVYSVHID
jgi:hypothetical protein